MWRKRGLVFVPEGDLWWSRSHAQLPVADFTQGSDIIRIYYSSRDAENRSRPGWVEVDASDPGVVVKRSVDPVLDLGAPGTFDDCGMMPSWIVNHGSTKYLYYIGWNVRNTVPYHNSVGLALSEDGGETFRRYAEGPLWERTTREPYFSGTACVLLEENGVWRAWYQSCTEWRRIGGRLEPRYHLKYAESDDGIVWRRDGTVAIDFLSDGEGGIAKASVLKDGGGYRMWFSYRGLHGYRTDPTSSYRIGYAKSDDGIGWIRLDSAAGIERSAGEWDGEMLAYPHVFRRGQKLTMLYNGNGFGRSGFGYAETEMTLVDRR